MNVVVFAVLGALVGAAARLLCPDRRFGRVLATLVVGAIGGVAGGMISWTYWPDVDQQFQAGNLIVSAVGAAIALVVGAAASYARRLRGSPAAAR